MIDFENYSEDYLICPYCGWKHDTDEAFFFDEDFDEYDCENCGKRFLVDTNVVWSWKTAKLNKQIFIKKYNK